MEISKKSIHYRFVHWSFGDFEVESSIFTYVMAFIGSVWVLPIRACLVGVKGKGVKNFFPLFAMTIGLLICAIPVVIAVSFLYPAASTGNEALIFAGIDTLPSFLAVDIGFLMGIVIVARVIYVAFIVCTQIRVKFV